MWLPEPGSRVRTTWGMGGLVQPYDTGRPAACSVPVLQDSGITRMLGPDQFTVVEPARPEPGATPREPTR